MVIAEFEQSLTELTSMPDQVATRVREIPANQWDVARPGAEGGWSRRQLLAHLATIDQRHATRVRRGAGIPHPQGVEDHLAIASIDAWNQKQVEARQGKSVDDLLGEMRRHRRDLVALLRSLTPEQREQMRIPRGEQTLTLAEYLPNVNGHVSTHLQDIVG